jgi:hypothetical protein
MLLLKKKAMSVVPCVLVDRAQKVEVCLRRSVLVIFLLLLDDIGVVMSIISTKTDEQCIQSVRDHFKISFQSL